MTTRTRITHAEYEALLARPEYAERRLELIHGEIVEKPMPTPLHAFTAAMLAFWIRSWLFQNPEIPADVFIEARHRPTGDALNDRIPDVSVVVGKRPIARRGAANFVPDICIEIQSPDQSLKGLREKARFYLAHGARYAVIVLPERQLVEVYQLEGDDLLLTAADALTFPDLLPGFTVEVGQLFPPADQLVDGDDA